MPLWTVDGADKKTGKDIVQSIDAPTEHLARATALEMGILVADIHRSAADPLEELGAAVQASRSESPTPAASDAPTLDYSTVRKNPSVPLIPTAAPAPLGYPTTPEYSDIITGVKWLRAIALITAILGWIGIAVAALALVMGLVVAVAGPGMGSIALGLPFVIPASIFGIAYLAVSAVLRLAASVALAVRDIARNSFPR
jgi:hypothetical protein